MVHKPTNISGGPHLVLLCVLVSSKKNVFCQMAMQERPGHRVETLGSPTTSLETCEGGGGVCSTEREGTNKWGVLGEILFYFQKIPSNSSRLDLTDFSYEQCDLKPCWLMISSGIILPNILGIYSNPIGESIETNQFL